MKKQYVQFSKRCVVAVLIAAHIVVLVGLFCMISAGDLSGIGQVLKCYFDFAGIVFIAYCGNSAIEKVAGKLTGCADVEISDNG